MKKQIYSEYSPRIYLCTQMILLKRENIPIVFIFLFFCLLTFYSRNIPFFWDEVYYIGTAHSIFDSNFHSLIPPPEFDRGSFPFYGLYMASAWKVFGKTLAVSHFAMLPFLLGVAWEYCRFAKKFLSDKWRGFALLLLALEPTFGTQSILMGHDILLVYFFLLALNCLLEGKKIFYLLSLFLLLFHNIKGLPAAFSLMLIYFFYSHYILNEKKYLPTIILHLLPLLLYLPWLFYHHLQTGWYMFTPVNDHSSGVNLNLFGLKRILLGTWQLIDFGKAFLWLFIFICGWMILRRGISIHEKKLFFITLISAAIPILYLAVLDVSLCHRYYMSGFLLSNIVAVFLMEKFLQKQILRTMLLVIFPIALLTGNCWIYGGGFSNGWDASLKVLPYFGLRDELIAYVKDESINPNDIGTKYPLYHDLKYSDLSQDSFHFKDMDTISLHQFKYILLSNISNNFTVEEKQELRSEWTLVKELKRGQVYLQLLKNPEANND